MRIVCNIKGVTTFGVLLFAALLGAGVWLGFQIIPFYYYYYELEGLMQAQAAKASEFRDDQIRKVLLKEIRAMKIPITDSSDLSISRYEGKIVIDLSYEEVLYVDLGEDRVYDLHVFPFNAHVEHEL